MSLTAPAWKVDGRSQKQDLAPTPLVYLSNLKKRNHLELFGKKIRAIPAFLLLSVVNVSTFIIQSPKFLWWLVERDPRKQVLVIPFQPAEMNFQGPSPAQVQLRAPRRRRQWPATPPMPRR